MVASRAPSDLPIAETRSPSLERWDWQQLERLTESLLAQEPGVSTASQYGKSGQSQYGIDTKAELSGGGCIVASCKKQDEVKDGQLAIWSTDFLKHWTSRWSTKGVRRFILVTTADISRTQVVDAADAERKRFAGHDVGYELWGQPQLIEKLRPHRGIVAQFFGVHWVDILCGPQQREALQPEGASVGVEGVGQRQIADLRAILTGQAEARVSRGLEGLRAGDVGAVAATLADLQAEPLWSELAPAGQARVLRFAASAALHRDDIDAAVEFAARADAIQVADEPRIAARIAYHRDGARAGLAVLGSPTSRDGRQLQVSLLLTVGELDLAEGVLADLDNDGPDPETMRLHAWALLMRNRRAEALALVEQLERDAGAWLATMRTAAIVRYAASLSPLLAPEWFLNASPVDLDLVRDDDAGRTLLESAIAGFQTLVAKTGDAEDRSWLLAALSNQRERREEAEALARAMVSELPSDPVVIAWSLARRYDVDLAASRAHFADRYAAGNTAQIDVRIFALLLVSDGDPSAARAVLAEHLAAQQGEARAEAEVWIARLTAELGDGEVSVAVPATDNLVDDIQRARADGDWSKVARGFAGIAAGEGGVPEPQTLAIAQLLAAEAQWDILAPHREAILAFGTSEAVRIVAYFVASNGDGADLLAFLEEHRAAFRGGELPPDVRRLVVDRQRRSGDLLGALAEAQALSAQSGVSSDRQLEAELRAGLGDTARAASIVRDLMQSSALGTAAALQWGELLRASDLALAQALWRYAIGQDGEQRHAIQAYFQALSLGLESEAGPLFEHVARAAKEGTHGVWSMHVDELPDVLRAQAASTAENHGLYLDGKIPAHLLAENEKIGLDTLLLGRSEDVQGPLRIRLLRNGARPRHLAVGLPWSAWRLHMDVSALLVAAEFDLLDVIEQLPQPVTISSAVPLALLEMQRGAAPGSPGLLAALEVVAGLLDAGLAVRRRRDGDRIVAARNTEPKVRADYDPAKLVSAAFEAGVIDEEEKLRALAELAALSGSGAGDARETGAEDDALATGLVAGDGLWLLGTAAGQLAACGLLPILCVAFDMGIDPDDSAIIVETVRTEGAKAARVGFLDGLRERLLRGIEAGRFVFVTRSARAEADNAEMASRSAATVSLMDMLIADNVEGGVTWFEDRLLTGYPANRGHALVQLVDVLDALAAEKVLNEAEIRSRLSRFLGSGGGFVQLEPADIIPAIRAAPIVGGVLRETPALAAIRRNRAAARLLDTHFKVGPNEDADDNRPDESPLFTGDMGHAADCFSAIWSDPSQTIEQCVIRSDWVWGALRVERSLRAIPETETDGAARHLATLCFASALESLAIPFDIPPGIRRTRRRAFADWFWNAVLGPHLVGDRGILARIADYYQQLYVPRLEGRVPDVRNQRLEAELLRLRVAALPRPVINVLSGNSALGPYLGTQTIQIITVRGARFEAGRFWRAVRAARRYGRSKTRTIDGRRCRIVRADNGIVISGAVRARLADELCGVFDAGVDPVVRFAETLCELELAPSDVETFMARARSASTPHAFSGALLDARKRSAKAHYAAMDDAFQPHRRIAGEAFLPPPAPALLHYLRLVPGDENFGGRLAAAARELRDAVGPAEALRRVAGLPIPGLLGIAGIERTPEITAELDRGMTPVAAFRMAEAALPATVDVAERKALVSSALGRMRHGADSLLAILNWSVKAWWQDRDFRALDDADRLALIWAHAGRVLDAFLRRRADPVLVARYFGEIEFNEPFSDALDTGRFGGADAASPASLTRDTFVFHALGSLIGDAPVADYLDDAEIAAVAASAQRSEGDAMVPAPSFTLRNFAGQNLLGSFLTAGPAGLLAVVSQPDAGRASLIRRAILGIKVNRDDALSWVLLAQHSRTGLSEAELAATREVLLAIDANGLAMGPRDGLPLPRVIVRTMGSLLLPEDRPRLVDIIRAVARSAAQQNASPAWQTDGDVGGALDPVNELLEVCATYAALERDGMFERFEAAVVATAEAWPAALPAIRDLVDRIIRTNGVVETPALWRLYLYLCACP